MSYDPTAWQFERIMWLDLETTGLDPETGLILEVAVVVTNRWLKELARESIVIPHSVEALEAAGMDDFVRDMHTENGLLDEVTGKDGFQGLSASDAEHRLLAL